MKTFAEMLRLDALNKCSFRAGFTQVSELIECFTFSRSYSLQFYLLLTHAINSHVEGSLSLVEKSEATIEFVFHAMALDACVLRDNLVDVSPNSTFAAVLIYCVLSLSQHFDSLAPSSQRERLRVWTRRSVPDNFRSCCRPIEIVA